jgi:uncharacterized membrane protein YkvA (DUF1232 family)
MLATIKKWARATRRESIALWLASRDARTPWYAKLFAALILLYALSPIDLIPDFIPVIGFLDEMLLLPAAIWLALKMIPGEVMVEARERAAEVEARPRSMLGAVLIVLVWVGAAAATGWYFLGRASRGGSG